MECARHYTSGYAAFITALKIFTHTLDDNGSVPNMTGLYYIIIIDLSICFFFSPLRHVTEHVKSVGI